MRNTGDEGRIDGRCVPSLGAHIIPLVFIHVRKAHEPLMCACLPVQYHLKGKGCTTTTVPSAKVLSTIYGVLVSLCSY